VCWVHWTVLVVCIRLLLFFFIWSCLLDFHTIFV
jgi:hypothetical protein